MIADQVEGSGPVVGLICVGLVVLVILWAVFGRWGDPDPDDVHDTPTPRMPVGEPLSSMTVPRPRPYDWQRDDDDGVPLIIRCPSALMDEVARLNRHHPNGLLLIPTEVDPALPPVGWEHWT